MIGTELVWSKIKSYGKALIITAAAAVINELIAVIAAKKGFEKAGELKKNIDVLIIVLI